MTRIFHINDIRRQTRVQFVYFLPSKLEFQDYMRRKLFTEHFRMEVQRPQVLADMQAALTTVAAIFSENKWPAYMLSDREIKAVRESCLRDHDGAEAGLRR